MQPLSAFYANHPAHSFQHLLSSGGRLGRGNRSRPLSKENRLRARPGAGFLPHAGKPFHLHVLDGLKSAKPP